MCVSSVERRGRNSAMRRDHCVQKRSVKVNTHARRGLWQARAARRISLTGIGHRIANAIAVRASFGIAMSARHRAQTDVRDTDSHSAHSATHAQSSQWPPCALHLARAGARTVESRLWSDSGFWSDLRGRLPPARPMRQFGRHPQCRGQRSFCLPRYQTEYALHRA